MPGRKLTSAACSVSTYSRMAKSGKLLAFQDHSIPFADNDEDLSSPGEEWKIEVASEDQRFQTSADCTWEFRKANDHHELTQKSPSLHDADAESGSGDEEPVKTAELSFLSSSNAVNRSRPTVTHGAVVRRITTPTMIIPPRKEARKRRAFKEMLCDGFSSVIHEIIALLEGRKRDADGDEVEYGPVRYVPHSLETLTQTTKFTKEELKTMYRTFKNECPTGVVYEETFKSIYSQFFPSGDANMYAHYIFNAFDANQEGFICFEDFVTALSSLLRGKLEEKLQWTFKLYDINKDGFITRDELQDIVKSVHALYGTKTDGGDYIDHANKVFRKLDRNGDGYVTYAEFLEACKNDDSIVASMRVFEGEM